MSFLRLLRDWEASGNAQIIVATHSPIIMSYPGAMILSFDGEKIEPVEYEETEHYRITKAFLGNPERYAKGTYPAKPLIPIIGGLLTIESDWSPALGAPMMKTLNDGAADENLDIGCVAAHGYFERNTESGDYTIHEGGKPATAFLFKLISMLQFSGTVPMIDIQAYARWLSK